MTMIRPTEKVLAVDPGNFEAGYVLLSYEEGFRTLHTFGKLRGKHPLRGKNNITKKVEIKRPAIHIGVMQIKPILLQANKDGCRTLVIEKQYLSMGKDDKGDRRSDPKAMTAIVEARMRWQVLAEWLGWNIVQVWPVQWQSKIVKHGNLKRKDRQEAVKVELSREFKQIDRTWTTDMVAALGIGVFATGINKQGNLPLCAGGDEE